MNLQRLTMSSIDPCRPHAISHHSVLKLSHYNFCLTSPSVDTLYGSHTFFRVSCISSAKKRSSSSTISKGGDSNGVSGKGGTLRGTDNVWSVDNKHFDSLINKQRKSELRKRRFKLIRRMKQEHGIWISAAMPMEVKEVTRPEESVISPVWGSFLSGICGLWKGVGATFSPTTAEMAPVDYAKDRQKLYDRYVLSNIEVKTPPSGQQKYQIFRKTHWGGFNPNYQNNCSHSLSMLKDISDHQAAKNALAESDPTEYIEEDLISYDNEPGLVFFEDGSYSRGPVEIPLPGSGTITLPTFLFEQCLVQGSERRLRIIHSVQFENGVSDAEVLLVLLFEEQLVGSTVGESELELDLKPFSERRRLRPSALMGSWKVFETTVAPVYPEKMVFETREAVPWSYTCTETLRKREKPKYLVGYSEQDLASAPVLWLPGGVTGYAYKKRDGDLCIGLGWFSEEGIHYVMERDYGPDSRLKSIRRKTEGKHPRPS